MNILSEEFESGIRMVVREQFKESYTDFLSHGTAEKRWLSIVAQLTTLIAVLIPSVNGSRWG